MKISTKGRYALAVVLELAQREGKGYIPLTSIARWQGISKQYLEQIIPLLSKGDILVAMRGAQGGYKLARPARKIYVGEILRLTEGSIEPVACLDNRAEGCDNSAACLGKYVWHELSHIVSDFLNNVSLEDVIQQHRGNAAFDYCI